MKTPRLRPDAFRLNVRRTQCTATAILAPRGPLATGPRCLNLIRIPCDSASAAELINNKLNIFKCSKSCGDGTQTRAVKCRDHLGQPVPDHRCHPSGRPEYSQTCHKAACPTPRTFPPDKTNYRWKTASWTTVGHTHHSAGIYPSGTNNPSGNTSSAFNNPTSTTTTTTTSSSSSSLTSSTPRPSTLPAGSLTARGYPRSRPTYSYFANYYRFDGWPVSRKKSGTSSTRP